MPGIGQITPGGEQLLFGVEDVEVDPLAATDAFLGGGDQCRGGSDCHFIGPHLGCAAGVEVELLAQLHQRGSGLRVQLVLGLGQLVGRLTGGGRDRATGKQRQADLDADAVGVVLLVVAAF